MKDQEYLYMALIILMLVSLSFIAGYTNPIRLDKPIELKLEITIENGVTDTTYIYER